MQILLWFSLDIILSEWPFIPTLLTKLVHIYPTSLMEHTRITIVIWARERFRFVDSNEVEPFYPVQVMIYRQYHKNGTSPQQ